MMTNSSLHRTLEEFEQEVDDTTLRMSGATRQVTELAKKVKGPNTLNLLLSLSLSQNFMNQSDCDTHNSLSIFSENGGICVILFLLVVLIVLGIIAFRL
jgi:hypothetical protein